MKTYCGNDATNNSCGVNFDDYPDETLDLKFGTEIVPVIGSGTDDYNDLINKPSINGVTLQGNKTNEELLIDAMTNVEIEELLKRFD